MPEHRAASGGEGDAARAAVEERDADGLLELLQLPGERGLRDVERGGGATDAAFLRDDREVPKLSKEQVSVPRNVCVSRMAAVPAAH